MKKIFATIAVIFPILTAFSLTATAFWWTETRDLSLLLTPNSIMTKNKWGLNSLRGYDDGLMPSIRSNVLMGLQSNLGTAIVKDLNVEIYYGHVDNDSFFNAKKIDFTDYNNTSLVLWFTVGIFATDSSTYKGYKFLEFDFRPIWDFNKNPLIKFDNTTGKIDNLDKLITSWNKLLNNQIILDNFNFQFQKMGLDITAGMELQPGQMNISEDMKFFINLSNQFTPENNGIITIKQELFNYVSDRLLSSFCKISHNTLEMLTGPTIKIQSADFKTNNYDYAILNVDVTLDVQLKDLYDEMKNFMIIVIKVIYQYDLEFSSFSLQFRKNGYSDVNLFDLNKTVRDLYTFAAPDGTEKHWIWLEMIDAKDTSIDLSSTPGFHLGFKV